MAEADPDLILVQALQAGEDRALNELMKRHQQKIFYFIFRHLSHEADSVELAQETFVRAYFNIHKFTPRGSFSTWLHQIALNLCRDHTRSKQWRQRQNNESIALIDEKDNASPLQLPSTTPNPAVQVQINKDVVHLNEKLNRLPLNLKIPLLLTAVDGLSVKEVASQMGLSPKAVELRIYRARKTLVNL